MRGRSWRWYHTAAGNVPPREELDDLHIDARAAVLEAMGRLKRLESMPYEEEHISADLHAVRIFFMKNTYRVLYAHEGDHDSILLALHVLHKKDAKLPKSARRLAERRLKDWRGHR